MNYNVGHSQHTFATRVRVLLLHPEIWQQVPDGLSVQNPVHRQLWIGVAEFLRAYDLLRPSTQPLDVNVPKLIAAVRRLEKRV